MDYSIVQIGTDLLRLQFPNMDITNNVLSLIEDKYIKDTKTYWQSKYNNYVCYDYEPFCTEGFNIKTDILFTSYNYMQYAKYLIEKFMANVDTLERSFNLNMDMRLKENRIIKDLQEA